MQLSIYLFFTQRWKQASIILPSGERRRNVLFFFFCNDLTFCLERKSGYLTVTKAALTLPKNENSVNLIFLVNKKVKVCDVLSKGSTNVVCSAGQKRHTLYRSARIQTYTHMCSGVFFSSSFFFLVSVSVLRHAASFPNPQTHLIEEVCVWVGGEGASMLSSQGDTESLPSIISSAPAHSVCLYACTGTTTHASLM